MTNIKTFDNKILNSVGKNLVFNCFKVKTEEPILLVYDEGKIREAAFFRKAIQLNDKNPVMLKIKMGKFDGEEPTGEVAGKLLNYPISLLVTTKSLSHTDARLKASKKGARIASLPGIDLPMIARTLSEDFTKLAILSEKIGKRLTRGKSVKVTTHSGTSLSFSITNRIGIADTGNLQNKGNFGNLPPGESFIAPVEESVNGQIVVDGCISDFSLDAPVILKIKNGKAVKITGNKTAKELKKALITIGNKAHIIGEFGIGTNKSAILSQKGENALEVEKVFGTVHFALGNNSDFGGINEVPFHIDMILISPTVEIDDKVILQNSKFNL